LFSPFHIVNSYVINSVNNFADTIIMEVTEDQITIWMQERIEKRDFAGAAGQPNDFLDEYDLANVLAQQPDNLYYVQ
jgi:hypothetical protein